MIVALACSPPTETVLEDKSGCSRSATRMRGTAKTGFFLEPTLPWRVRERRFSSLVLGSRFEWVESGGPDQSSQQTDL